MRTEKRVKIVHWYSTVRSVSFRPWVDSALVVSADIDESFRPDFFGPTRLGFIGETLMIVCAYSKRTARFALIESGQRRCAGLFRPLLCGLFGKVHNSERMSDISCELSTWQIIHAKY